MAFTPKDWKDYPDTSTPITAAALEDLETRVVAAGLDAITASGKKVAWGTGTITLGTATNNWYVGQGSVTHGLGATPVLVLAVPKQGGTVIEEAVSCLILSIGGTTFDVQIRANNAYSGTAVNGATIAYYWLAIG